MVDGVASRNITLLYLFKDENYRSAHTDAAL